MGANMVNALVNIVLSVILVIAECGVAFSSQSGSLLLFNSICCHAKRFSYTHNFISMNIIQCTDYIVM